MTPEEHKKLTDMVRTCGVVHFKLWLETHPPVLSCPLTELQALVDGPDLQGGVWNAIRKLIAKHSPPELPPNPEKPGAWRWAREEWRRSHSVARIGLGRGVNYFDKWAHAQFSDEDVEATDWEVVP